MMQRGDGPQELWGSEAGGSRGHEALSPRKKLPGGSRVHGAQLLDSEIPVSLLPKPS